ncbi:Na+/H+ antiporter subunit E [Solidesulfovibrio sp.]
MPPAQDVVTVARKSAAPGVPKRRRRAAAVSFLLRFLPLFALWLLLSGMFDPFHLSLGVACCAFVAWLSADIFPPEFSRPGSLRVLPGLCLYLPWLVWEIAKANIRLLLLVCHPRVNTVIDPKIVTFKTALRSRLSLTLLANSITLTPGTITVSIDERGYVSVHAIDGPAAAGVPGDMERKLVAIFKED